jgi:biotin synthase-like enzyme
MEQEVDYYFNEEGLMVFTAAYHLKRGKCCKNKCRHCPWNFGKKSNQADLKPKKKIPKR